LAWRIEFDAAAEKELAKIDKQAQKRILQVLRKRIAPNNPRDFGEPLRGELAGLWKYRVGDYRIVSEIQDGKLLVLVVRIGHRRRVYGGH
jgi:mRNA interferase RelE/StbE